MIGIVCHDAGAAEIISSWISKNKNQYIHFLKGPALKIFKRKLKVVRIHTLSEVIAASDWILCGTGWQSDIEKKAIQLAKNNRKKVVSYLDHWVNYGNRFKGPDGCISLPDEIWVGDKYALDIANSIFKDTVIKLVENQYFEDVKIKFKNRKTVKNKSTIRILYVCEPIIKHGEESNLKAQGYDEKDALVFFLRNTSKITRGQPYLISVRPHPSESCEKYSWVQKIDPNINVNKINNLVDDIENSDIVVGCETMAMVIAILSGRKVFSSIPPGNFKCNLPYNEIIYIRDISQ